MAVRIYSAIQHEGQSGKDGKSGREVHFLGQDQKFL